MKIKDILKKHHKIETELFLAYILKKPKEFLFINPEHELSSYQVKSLSRLVKRREKGEPIAYILGYKDFCGLRFKVNKNVLIPRPETEELVNQVLKVYKEKQSVIPGASDLSAEALLTHRSLDEVGARAEALSTSNRLPRLSGALKPRNDTIRILDVGTGSGCIAISLYKLMETQNPNIKFQITALDISKKALEIAKQNAKYHKAKVIFKHSDILQNVGMLFDVIVANLPYVPKKNYESSIKNLGWEPKLALVDPKKDFDIYQRLFKQIASLPSLPKVIFLEIDPSQKRLSPKIIKKYLSKTDIKFHKDFNNLWRFVEITIKNNHSITI